MTFRDRVDLWAYVCVCLWCAQGNGHQTKGTSIMRNITSVGVAGVVGAVAGIMLMCTVAGVADTGVTDTPTPSVETVPDVAPEVADVAPVTEIVETPEEVETVPAPEEVAPEVETVETPETVAPVAEAPEESHAPVLPSRMFTTENTIVCGAYAAPAVDYSPEIGWWAYCEPAMVDPTTGDYIPFTPAR